MDGINRIHSINSFLEGFVLYVCFANPDRVINKTWTLLKPRHKSCKYTPNFVNHMYVYTLTVDVFM